MSNKESEIESHLPKQITIKTLCSADDDDKKKKKKKIHYKVNDISFFLKLLIFK